jgi:hypothetical protein
VSGVAGRLRRAALAAGQALGGRPPGVELVRVTPPDPPAPSQLPLRALPAPAHPLCPYCRTRHARTLPSPWSSWSTSPLPDLGRPAPLGRAVGVDERALDRDRFHPWREP